VENRRVQSELFDEPDEFEAGFAAGAAGAAGAAEVDGLAGAAGAEVPPASVDDEPSDDFELDEPLPE
jgi:hypothetical protein